MAISTQLRFALNRILARGNMQIGTLTTERAESARGQCLRKRLDGGMQRGIAQLRIERLQRDGLGPLSGMERNRFEYAAHGAPTRATGASAASSARGECAIASSRRCPTRTSPSITDGECW